MVNIIFAIASFILAECAFVYGAVNLFRKRKPLYLQLLVCASGCFAIEQLSSIVNLWCGVSDNVTIGMFGIFGCNFFLLSANYGTLDRIVDDGKKSKKIKTISVVAPIVMIALVVGVFFAWKDKDLFCAIMWIVMLIPALPASYFNLKHILLPMDPFEFLKITKPCNIIALTFYGFSAMKIICSAFELNVLSGIMLVIASLSMQSLTIYAVKGAKKWGI